MQPGSGAWPNLRACRSLPTKFLGHLPHFVFKMLEVNNNKKTFSCETKNKKRSVNHYHCIVISFFFAFKRWLRVFRRVKVHFLNSTLLSNHANIHCFYSLLQVFGLEARLLWQPFRLIAHKAWKTG